MLRRALILILLAASLAYAQSGAGGGNITPANLALTQPLSQWYFFYSSPYASSGSVITFNSSGHNYQPVSLPDTTGFYLLSDSESPFSSPLAAANLTQFDAHFNLSSVESAARLFNDSSAFALPLGTSTPVADLALPTLYLPGHADTHAFRVGLAQAGSDFIFVVPKQTATGMDGQSYDFQFFLPYSYGGTQTYHVFSITPPLTPDTGGVKPGSLNYRWSYNGSRLLVQTEAGASLSLIDALGKAYNAGANSEGQAQLDVPPGRYILHLSKSGFNDLSDTIYLLAAAPLPENESLPAPNAPESPQVSITRSLEGITMCVDDACYFQAVSQADSGLLLTDLNCVGSLCQLINISPYSYIQKHQLVRMASAPASAGPMEAGNLSALLESLSQGLAGQLGGTSSPSSPGFVVYFLGAIVLAGGAVFLISKAWPPGSPPQGGYD